MFNWIREWRHQRMFNRAWQETTEAKWKAGELSRDEYNDCKNSLKYPEALKRARNQLKCDPDMLGGIEWNWDAIYQWFIEYFIPAMKIIIPIVILLLQENPNKDDE